MYLVSDNIKANTSVNNVSVTDYISDPLGVAYGDDQEIKEIPIYEGTGVDQGRVFGPLQWVNIQHKDGCPAPCDDILG